jgi:hypothetical protein
MRDPGLHAPGIAEPSLDRPAHRRCVHPRGADTHPYARVLELARVVVDGTSGDRHGWASSDPWLVLFIALVGFFAVGGPWERSGRRRRQVAPRRSPGDGVKS